MGNDEETENASNRPTLDYYSPTSTASDVREERDARICGFLIACTIISVPGLCLIGGMMKDTGLFVTIGIQAALAGGTTLFAMNAQRFRMQIGANSDQRVDAAFGLGAMILAFALIPLLVFACWFLLFG